MRGSTKKSPTYSPPRRESIDDHLTVVRRRCRGLGIHWTEELATPAFVKSLIKKKIINGPVHAGGKSEGRGVQSRFHPRDYRDLLEVIRLKSLGVKRRNAWVLHLWLRGHEYPIARVRDALVAEAQRIADNALREIAPTGRFEGDFMRRVRRVSARSGNAGKHDDLLAFVYAMMVRPSQIRKINITPASVANLLCEGTAVKRTDVLPVAEKIVRSIKNGTSLGEDTIASVNSLLQQSPHGQVVLQSILARPNPKDFVGRLYGVYADDRGRSRLVTAIRDASHESLINARNWRRLIRSVTPSALQAHVERIPAAEQDKVLLGIWALREIRASMFAHPDSDALNFMYLVDDEAPVALSDYSKSPISVNGVLDLLKRASSSQNV